MSNVTSNVPLTTEELEFLLSVMNTALGEIFTHSSLCEKFGLHLTRLERLQELGKPC